MIRESISKQLKAKGLSQRKCALACNIDPSDLTAFLKTRRLISVEKIEAVLEFLELKIEPK